MKAIYFDCFSGISGDMTLGALLDLGIDKDEFKSELLKLNLFEFDISIDKVVRNAITGTDVNVILTHNFEQVHKMMLNNEKHLNHNHHHTHTDHHHHDRTNHHHHEHANHHHNEEHSHQNDQNTHGRNLNFIEKLINSSDLNQKVKDFAIKVFKEIARAEAKVHNKSINEIHFHEVGAVDSIVDIVGVSICLDMLGVDIVFSSPLHEGRGFVKCQHGLLPIPVPAVLEMLNGSRIPIISEDIPFELVTPTGIGIIKCLANSFGNMPAMIIDKVGYGFGKRDIGRLNALRVVVGTLFGEERLSEEVVLVETNIDDLQPEVLGYTMERLFEEGALDAFYSPIYMKKNRPSSMLTVICKKEDEEKMVDLIFRETTTLGIRRRVSQRYALERSTQVIKTPIGDVNVKMSNYGNIKKAAPEYEDCRAIAKKSGLPLIGIYEMVKKGIEN
jgi:uncharacterized protein (TIGR00299 family) protein